MKIIHADTTIRTNAAITLLILPWKSGRFTKNAPNYLYLIFVAHASSNERGGITILGDFGGEVGRAMKNFLLGAGLKGWPYKKFRGNTSQGSVRITIRRAFKPTNVVTFVSP
jgi:hypothetical protein